MSLSQLYTAFLPSPTFFSRTHVPILPTTLYQEDTTTIIPRTLFPTCGCKHRRVPTSIKASAATANDTKVQSLGPPGGAQKRLRVLVAGGGIGGLAFALAAKRKGFDVKVFEKDLSAIRGEGQYRGPIQLQSNALAALEAIDAEVADEIMSAGCVTGDRINGLVDGVSGQWYCKFDTFTPAVERGLPVTRVISRMTLQEILAKAVGEEITMNNSNVVDFVDDGTKVTVILEDGRRFEGDLLVGADGIRSKVRGLMFGNTEPVYSGYTCYTGIADIETVGYRVFLGHKQYFVSSDVGAGKMQWYAFHNEAPGGADVPNGRKERLLKLFGEWCDNVIDLIHATEEEAVLRRDIYDRTPIMKWGKGRVTLLGDSVHAMQPNLGQGGCMAIEDSYQLALELEEAWNRSVETRDPVDINSAFKRYEEARRVRVSIIYGLARMAANMAITYRPYLGIGLGPLSFLTKFRIPHPGRVGGRFFIKRLMPQMLSWVLGGNSSKLEGRAPSCRLSDKASNQLRRWFEDDDALERALSGEWYLFPMRNETDVVGPIHLSKEEKGSLVVGNCVTSRLPELSKLLPLPLPQISEAHARIHYKDNAFYLTDLGSQHGTWISDIEGRRHQAPPNLPARFHPSDVIEFGSDKKAVFRVKVLKNSQNGSSNSRQQMLQAV